MAYDPLLLISYLPFRHTGGRSLNQRNKLHVVFFWPTMRRGCAPIISENHATSQGQPPLRILLWYYRNLCTTSHKILIIVK